MTASSTAALTNAAWASGTEGSLAFTGTQRVPAHVLRPSRLPDNVVKLAGKVEESIVDGPGLRYVLFTQGCPHHCPGCHNPATHDFAGGVQVSLADIWQDIRKNTITRGVTFSGGEPFSQSEALTPLAVALKQAGYHLMAYTGHLMEELLETPRHAAFLACLDLVVDGPFIREQRSLELKFRGSANQRFIDVPLSLLHGYPVTKTI